MHEGSKSSVTMGENGCGINHLASKLQAYFAIVAETPACLDVNERYLSYEITIEFATHVGILLSSAEFSQKSQTALKVFSEL